MRAISWAAALGIAIALFVFSGQTGEASGKLSMGLAERLLGKLPFLSVDVEKFDHILRKTAHFCLFAAEGFALYAAISASLRQRKRALSATLALSAVLAVLNELYQLTSVDRSCRISDMLLDFSGATVGALAAIPLICGIKRLFRRR